MSNKLKTYTASYRLNDSERYIDFHAYSMDEADQFVDALSRIGQDREAFPGITLEGELEHSEPVHFQSHSEH